MHGDGRNDDARGEVAFAVVAVRGGHGDLNLTCVCVCMLVMVRCSSVLLSPCICSWLSDEMQRGRHGMALTRPGLEPVSAS